MGNVEDDDEETVQSFEENTEEVLAISNGKPPPKPPRLKVEGEENADVLNNNESKETTTKADRKENELNVKQNGKDEEEANDGERRENREKSEEGRKEKRAENQKRAEKENKDPNRPRYTKAEMLEILTERNNFKGKSVRVTGRAQNLQTGVSFVKFYVSSPDSAGLAAHTNACTFINASAYVCRALFFSALCEHYAFRLVIGFVSKKRL